MVLVDKSNDKDTCFLKKLNKDRLCEKLFCDVALNVRGAKFLCHRFVLCQSSGYFRRMFRSRLEECGQCEVKILGPLDDELEPNTMQQILEFIYTGNVRIQDDNVYEILFAADYLDICKLKLLCFDYIRIAYKR